MSLIERTASEGRISRQSLEVRGGYCDAEFQVRVLAEDMDLVEQRGPPAQRRALLGRSGGRFTIRLLHQAGSVNTWRQFGEEQRMVLPPDTRYLLPQCGQAISIALHSRRRFAASIMLQTAGTYKRRRGVLTWTT